MTKNNQKITFLQEILRKIFHLGLILLPFLYVELGKWQFLQILLPLTIIISIFDYFRRKNDQINQIFTKIFSVILRPKEKNQLTGLSNALIAASIIFLLCKKEIAVLAFLILAFCDLAAAIFGRAIKSEKFFEKSFAGAAAFLITGILVLIFAGKALNIGIFFYFFALISLFAAAIIESRPNLLKIDDNFTIPATFAALMTFFDLIWHLIP